jgi:hypothetical protein
MQAAKVFETVKNQHTENRKSISDFPVSDFIDKCTYLTACTDSPTTWDAADRSAISGTPDLEEFFGDDASGPGNYSQCVEHGIGRGN